MLTKDSTFRGRSGSVMPLDVKAVGDDGEFEGYGSVFGVADQGRDIVVAGAFSRSLARRPAARIKMLWQHDTHTVIGTWSEVAEDAKGLFVRGKLLTEVQAARECYALMKAGAIDGLSIGYRTVNDEYDRESGIRTISEAELYEVSVVTMPMNEAATVSLVKSDGLAAPKEFEALLRDAGLSRKQATAFVAGGYNALKNLRDAGDRGEDRGVLDALRELRGSLA